MNSRLRALWRTLFDKEQLDEDLDEELRAYVELLSAEKMRAGFSPEEAYRAASREAGRADDIKQRVRDVRTGALLERLAQDVRYGVRTLRKNSAFSLVAVATLALGIGANTAMFSLLDQIVLRLLPVKQPDRLVKVAIRGNNFGNTYGADRISWPMFEDLRDRNQVFSDMFCRFPATVNLGNGDRAGQVKVELVSGAYFSTLGIEAALGRVIAPADDVLPDSHPVVVLSYGFWQAYFHADRSIVGRTISLNNHPMTVIGVAQPGFDGVEIGTPAKLFVPIMMKTEMTPFSDGLKDGRRRLAWVAAYGRLKPGMTAQQAQSSLQPLLHRVLAMEVELSDFRNYNAEDRQQFLRNRIELLPGSESSLQNSMRKPLWILIVLTGVVLLLACANLANLMLARATAREREIAVRLAIGAARARIVRQLLVETLLLSGVGTCLGLVVAFVADRLLLTMYLPADQAAVFVVSPLPDWPVLSFAFGILLLTALAFGLVPAVRGSRTDIAPSLQERVATGSAAAVPLRRLLVVVQVALSFVLLVGAALFVRTLRNLRDLGPGFPTDHLLTFNLDPSLNGYTREQIESFYERLNVDLQAMPGIQSVGFSSMPLLKGYGWQNAIIGDKSSGAPNEEQPVLSTVGPNYFSTLGIPLLEGREFTEKDRAPFDYAVVNQSFAKRYLSSGDSIGKHFGLVNDSNPALSRQTTLVIGIIPDTKYRDLREDPPPQAFFPYLEGPNFRGMHVYLRTQDDPRLLEDQLRQRMRHFDPHVPIMGLETMKEQIVRSLRTEELIASLSAIFGGLAVLLAGIGLYGVLAYTVTRRTREIGIRIALGATRSRVIRMVLSEASLMVLAGLSAGLILVMLFANLIRNQLFELNPHDPWTIAGSALCLAIAAGLAGVIPAVRASGIDPTSALRQE